MKSSVQVSTGISRSHGRLDAIERDAQTPVATLPEELGGWRSKAGSWSVAECLDHLATASRVYLRAMCPSSHALKSYAGKEQSR